MLNAFKMSTAMAMVLLGGLRWLKPETTLSEMGSRAEAVECLSLKPCWEERVPSASMMDGRVSRSNIFVFAAFRIGIMMEFFQIVGMLMPATERMKSSVRKAKSCGPRWQRWSTVSPSGPWAVEEPALLTAAATPHRTASKRDPHGCGGGGTPGGGISQFPSLGFFFLGFSWVLLGFRVISPNYVRKMREIFPRPLGLNW